MNDIGSSIMGLLSTNHRSNDAMFAMDRSRLHGMVTSKYLQKVQIHHSYKQY